MFRNRLYLAMISGHYIVDVLNSLGAVLLAVLAVPLGLSYAQIGLALTVYVFAGSLSQPFFGLLADRFHGRTALLAAIAILWMALFYTVVALAGSWNMLLGAFLMAALGSGLFHPIGTANAAALIPERAATATSVFFFCGQMGLATGPIIGGLLFRSAGALGVLPIAALTLLPIGLLLFSLNGERAAAKSAAGKPKRARKAVLKASALIIAAFVMLVAVRSSIQAVYQAFLPILFARRGWDPALYGLLAGVFMATAAVGNVITGGVADRFGMRSATFWPLVASVPAGLLCIAAPSPLAAFVGCGFAGLLVGGQHSVLVVHAQRLLPTGQGFSAGLILGFTFGAGAIGTWLSGLSADSFSLPVVMQAVTWLGVPAALLALTLPGREPVVEPATAEAGEAAGATAGAD